MDLVEGLGCKISYRLLVFYMWKITKASLRYISDPVFVATVKLVDSQLIP